MSGPPPPVALVRTAVRRALRDLTAGSLVLVACSGGPDSLALAGATAFVAPRLGLRAGGITVDHGLQEGSAERADSVAALLRDLGFAPVERVSVTVGTTGGPEAAARSARYAALDKAADIHRASAVLLGHTRDDQAETVLLRLARGSGARSLAAMAPRTAATGALFWTWIGAPSTPRPHSWASNPGSDPHNVDPAYTRSRVRHDALPALERVLGPGVTEALARTATLLRDDADALDEWADQAQQQVGRGPTALDVTGLASLPRAIRTRLLRRIALAAGCPASALTAEHVFALDRLVTAWRGQSHVDLPGARRGRRRDGLITVSAD